MTMLAPEPTMEAAMPHCQPLAGGTLARTPPPAKRLPTPNSDARVAEYDALNLPLLYLAENLNDIETTRISMANRLRQLSEHDAAQADLVRIQLLLEGLEAIEHQATLEVQRAMRKHPLGPWVKRSKGIGEKQAARLLAAIGNPYWNSLHDRPRRGPAELWAYCGYHVLPASQTINDTHGAPAGGQLRATPTDQVVRDDQQTSVGGVAPKRRKGQRSNWNSAARMRAYLVADSCMKSPGGEYRRVYEQGREKYVELPKGHAHNRALRLVAKAVLRDVFLEARAWHLA